jgi:hypothetical protein
VSARIEGGGGDITCQGRGEQQMVVFTFSGEISPEQMEAWNQAISTLKDVFGDRLVGFTMKGHR